MATQVHPVCLSCILGVYMNSLRDAGFRSETNGRETFSEPWRKKFDLFLKTAFYVSKGTFWVKKTFWKFCFFQTLRTFEQKFTVLARKLSAGIAKLKIAVFVSKDQSKNQIFETSLFFQFLQNFERTITVLGENVFGRDIKIESCSHRLIRSFKNSFFWKFSSFSKSSELWANIYRAGLKILGQGY